MEKLFAFLPLFFGLELDWTEESGLVFMVLVTALDTGTLIKSPDLDEGTV
jgi:hypothetical protein